MHIKKLFQLSILIFFWNQTNAQVVDTKIKHTVQSGETLHSITRDYLGTDILWQENWKLNPTVQNPNLLSIGQELTIIKQRIIPAEKATMIEVVNHVEIKVLQEEWKTATLGDELKQKQGVRTYDESSALLRFNDESELKILAFSQVFLQSRKTTLSGTDSATIEITKGDAELVWEPIKAGYSEITLISGTTKLKPIIDSGEIASLRASITNKGNSVVSMYEGNSNIESAGKSVAIPEGMGVRVKSGQTPPKPKPLLKAPIIGIDNTSFNYANPILKWNKVKQASKYLIELCNDKPCNSIFMQLNTPQNEVQITKLKQKGLFYWRVSAVSHEEIIGYKSQINQLNINNDKNDGEPPIIAIDIKGIHKFKGNQVTIAPNAKLSIHTIDELSGVRNNAFKYDNQQWQEVSSKLISLPDSDSTLYIRSTDNLNHTTTKEYKIKFHRAF